MRVAATSAVLALLTLTAVAPAAVRADTSPTPSTQAPAETHGPKAVPVEAVVDAGTVAKGEKIKTTFEIKNEGDQTLEITDVRPSCGCTIATYDKTVAPGKVGKV